MPRIIEIENDISNLLSKVQSTLNISTRWGINQWPLQKLTLQERSELSYPIVHG